MQSFSNLAVDAWSGRRGRIRFWEGLCARKGNERPTPMPGKRRFKQLNRREAFQTVMKYPIAEKELIACHPDGERQRVKIQVGRPFRLERYEWAVSVHLEGLYHSLPDVHGEDSYEALALSFALLHRLLREFVEQGASCGRRMARHLLK